MTTTFTYIGGSTSTTTDTVLSSSSYTSASTLISVTIANTVTELAATCFQGATNLGSVVLPNSITTIGTNCFTACANLTSATLPTNASFTVLPSACFSSCTLLASMVVPNSVTSIGNNCWINCTHLTSLTLPNQLVSIGVSACKGCSSLSSIVFPNTVTTIGATCFQFCTSLSSVTLPSNASFTLLSNNVFDSCAFTSFTIPSTITFISNSCFRNCNQLTSILIPQSVLTISTNCFNLCSRLALVTFENASVAPTSIGTTPFANINSAGSPAYPTITFQQVNTFSTLTAALQTVVWPSGTQYVYSTLFHYIVDGTPSTSFTTNSTLTPTSYTTELAPNLVSIEFGNTVTIIDTICFQGCSSLDTISFPTSLSTISNNAFAQCTALTSLFFPRVVLTIGDNAFLNCSHLASVTFENATIAPTTIGTTPFSTINSAGSPDYPTVTFQMAANSASTTSALQSVVWPSNSVFIYDPSCFSSSTCILCLSSPLSSLSEKETENESNDHWIPITELQVGTLVKTYKEGYRRVKTIAKGHAHVIPKNDKSYMYSLISSADDALVGTTEREEDNPDEPLTITGEHSILLDQHEITNKERENMIWQYGLAEQVHDKQMVAAMFSNRFVKRDDLLEYDYYHFIVENDGDVNKRYGVWANGQLVETPTEAGFNRCFDQGLTKG